MMLNSLPCLGLCVLCSVIYMSLFAIFFALLYFSLYDCKHWLIVSVSKNFTAFTFLKHIGLLHLYDLGRRAYLFPTYGYGMLAGTSLCLVGIMRRLLISGLG